MIEPTILTGPTGLTATLYLGDCLGVLPTLAAGSVDAVVTDPPWKASNGSRVLRRPGDGLGVAPSRKSTSLKYGSIGHFDSGVIRECVRVSSADVLVLCGYMELQEVLVAIEPVRGIFVWHNTRPCPIPGPVAVRDVSFVAWGGQTTQVTNGKRWRSCLFQHNSLQAGCMATERILNQDGSTAHPAQEPLSLFLDIIDPLGNVVLDPYLGSGTTGVACAQTGRHFIGIEIDPSYFAIAVKRIGDALKQPRLL